MAAQKSVHDSESFRRTCRFTPTRRSLGIVCIFAGNQGSGAWGFDISCRAGCRSPPCRVSRPWSAGRGHESAENTVGFAGDRLSSDERVLQNQAKRTCRQNSITSRNITNPRERRPQAILAVTVVPGRSSACGIVVNNAVARQVI